MKTFNYYIKLIFTLSAVIALAGCFGDDDDNYSRPVTNTPPPLVSVVEVAADDDNFSMLVSLLQATNLDDTLSDLSASYTVFAPTNAAFEALGEETLAALEADPDRLAAILTYHVLGSEVRSPDALAAAGTTQETVNGASIALSTLGDTLFVNLSAVTDVDKLADNGVIHTIDTVLIPPTVSEPTQTIAEIVTTNEDFETLEAALIQANLVAPFEDAEGEFTVFAPNDAAFDKIDPNLLDAILLDADALDAILKQHVVEGAVDAVTAFSLSGNEAETLGANVAIQIVDGDTRALTVGGSTVVVTDIHATNGIIHVIDSVIIGDVPLPSVYGTLVEVAQADPQFSTLVDFLVATELDDVLGNIENNYTVFAPTNDAFAALSEEVRNELAANPEALANVLQYHVLPGKVNSEAALALAGSTVDAVSGDELAISQQGEDLFINLSKVTTPNVMADNGIIHVIDAVLTPVELPEEPQTIADVVATDGNFETLLEALTTAGLDSAFADDTRSFTVFAPTDAAFAAIPENVLTVILNTPDLLTPLLLQHAIEGEPVNSVTALSLSGQNVATMSEAEIPVEVDTEARTLKVGGATVTTKDIYTSNGIIHVIDAVIVGELTLPEGNIVEVATANGFSTLVDLVAQAGLADALSDPDATLTVFAPTNAAFEALGQETLDALGNDLAQLADVLQYHVLATEVNAEAAINAAGGTVQALNEDLLGLSLQGEAGSEALFVNLSKVTLTDVAASNGIIHVIDAVLLPPAESEATQSITEIVVASDDFDTLETAVIAAGLDDDLGDENASLTVFAPTDDAFAKIDPDLLQAIINDVPTLQAILQQHVVGSEIDAATAYSASGTQVTTLGGPVDVAIDADVDADDRALVIGGEAKVTITDIQATNGIIHVIDTVIIGEVALPSVEQH